MDKYFKYLILMIIDFSLCATSIMLSYWVRYDDLSVIKQIDYLNLVIPSLLFVIILLYFKFYNNVTRFLTFSFKEFYKIFLIFLIIYTVIIFYFLPTMNIYFDQKMTLGSSIPKSTIVTVPIFLYILFILSRFFFKKILILLFIDEHKLKSKNHISYAILGADDIEYQIYDYFKNYKSNFRIKYFIDDDVKFKNRKINNIDIISTKEFINKKEKNLILYVGEKFSQILSKDEIRKNYSKFANQIIFTKIINKKVDPKSLEQNILNIDDLIPSSFDQKNLKEAKKYLDNLNILVTGGGGSIGSELVSQIYLTNVKKIYVLDSSEYNLFCIKQKLTQLLKYDRAKIIEVEYLLSDVSDENIVKFIAKKKIDGVFHAAAYKHVDLVENNIFSGVKNNIFSTYFLCKHFYKIKNLKFFVLISTDKAVRPKSIMGISKNISENIVKYYNNFSKAKFFSVRFGNVINSSGSVIPIFKEQILSGNKVTITNKKATRYFMSIPEAVNLILCSIKIKIDTDIFYFDMGSPIKIYDLANKIANLLGKKLVKKSKTNDEVEYKIIGLRKGEKLHEELLIPKNSKLRNTKINNILYLLDNKKHVYNNLPSFSQNFPL